MDRQLPFDDDRAPIFTVGQVADMLGVQPAFLRRLEHEALVFPARSVGGQRRYTKGEVRRVARIVDLAGEGLTLTGVRRVLELQTEVDRLHREIAALRADPAD